MKNFILIAIVIAFITSLESCSNDMPANRPVSRFEKINTARELCNISYNLIPNHSIAEYRFHEHQIYVCDSLLNVELLGKINAK